MEYRWVPKSQHVPSAATNPSIKRQPEYQWVQKTKPSSSALPTTLTEQVKQPTDASTLTRQNPPKEMKLQVWKPKPLSQKQPLHLARHSANQSMNNSNSFLKPQTYLQSFDQSLDHSMEIKTATSTVATQAYTTHGNPQLLNGFPVCCPTTLIEYESTVLLEHCARISLETYVSY